MSAFDPFLPLGQEFVERQDGRVGCAGGEKLCCPSPNVAKFQMTFRLVFDFPSPVEDGKDAKEGRSGGFRAERL